MFPGTLFQGGGRGGFGMLNMQMLGIVSALKSGDPTTDTIIAIFVPMLLGILFNFLRQHSDQVTSWIEWMFSWNYHKRNISYRTIQTEDGAVINVDEDSCNSFLIQGIKLYVHKCCDLKLQEADMDLTSMDNMLMKDANDGGSGHPFMAFEAMRGNPNGNNSNNNNNKKGNKKNSTSTSAMLKACTLIKNPIPQTWHEVGTYDGNVVYIWMKDSVSDNNSFSNGGGDAGPQPSGNSARNVEVRLKSKGATSIDSFIDKCYKWYTTEIEKLETNDRFMYDLRGFDGRGNYRMPTFSKYTLGNDKTFSTLFSEQCTNLLGMVNQFQNKTGKYAIPGYPHKLGLLLHGPPGTGKTSLIKAMAHHTNRHIVNVPLARLATNQELMAVFFNKTFTVPGSPKNPTLGFEDIIFVLEDVDATSEVVKARQQQPSPGQQGLNSDAAAAAAAAAHPMPSSVPNLEVQRMNHQNAEALEIVKNLPAAIGSAMHQATRGGNNNNKRNTFVEDNDRLDLTGLLNALDGVVDTPGRIVIMTTNHPEMLDPALIRPGRIDKQLELSYMIPKDIIAMIQHYFQVDELSQEQKEFVYRLFSTGEGNFQVTPAKVEQLVMEHESIDELLDALEQFVMVSPKLASSVCSTTSTVSCSDEDDLDNINTTSSNNNNNNNADEVY